MRRRIDNFRFDDLLFHRPCRDGSVEIIRQTLWTTYDDLKRHQVSIDAYGWKAMRRCIAFLDTGYELPTDRRERIVDNAIWPFQSRLSIIASRPKLARYHVPRFDASVHNRPIRRWNFRITWWNVPVILFLIVGLPALFGYWMR